MTIGLLGLQYGISPVVQQQSTDDSAVATFAAGEKLTETQNAIMCNVSSTTSLESEQSNILESHQLVPAHTKHSSITPAIKSFGQVLSSHYNSKDDATVAREDGHSDDQSISTLQSSQLQSSAVRQLKHSFDSERSKLFGLPRRINVSKREMNMMSPLSF